MAIPMRSRIGIEILPVSYSLAKPLSTSSCALKCCKSSCLLGTSPMSYFSHISRVSPRRAKYSTMSAFFCSLRLASSFIFSSTSLGLLPTFCALSYSRAIPVSSLSLFNASLKSIFSYSLIKWTTSPPLPQPKHLNIPFASLTTKLGDFSLWNGQQAI